ncbi:MAG: hypothetical protein V2A73_04245 [Pseudomonadota bacterium]
MGRLFFANAFLSLLLAACSDELVLQAATADYQHSSEGKGVGSTPRAPAIPAADASGGAPTAPIATNGAENPGQAGLVGKSATREGRDFVRWARLLYQVAACGGDDPVPEGFDSRVVANHCRILGQKMERFRQRWLRVAAQYLAKIVPATVPRVVVYPFGGGDLMVALTTFPDATELTTLSLEPAGDVRSIERIKRARLERSLAINRENLSRFFAVNHSKTTNLSLVARGDLPGELVFTMAALVVHGYEPVSLRYFGLEPDGSIAYLDIPDDDAAAGNDIDNSGEALKGHAASGVGDSGLAAGSKERIKAARARFNNVEMAFRLRGAPDGTPVRVLRHIAANLDNVHLEKDPSVVRYLERRGRVAAMTKAASYLLWWGEFSTVREYLLANMEWMVSDSTGIPPVWAKTAGFEQDTYGAFNGPFLPAGKWQTEQFRRLWRANSKTEMPFMFGYPDVIGNPHMLVTRRSQASASGSRSDTGGNPETRQSNAGGKQ